MPRVQIVEFQGEESLQIIASIWLQVVEDIDTIMSAVHELGGVIHQWEGFPADVEIPEQATKQQLLALAGIC